jgi:hypothetical protein
MTHAGNDAALRPLLVDKDGAPAALRDKGFALLDARATGAFGGVDAAALLALSPSWDALPEDEHLKDHGRYRHRRHGCFVVDGAVTAAPPRPHYQPVAYNALHGGLLRWFAPLDDEVRDSAALQGLLQGLARCADAVHGARPWFVEVHQFRITTAGGIGRPTPEGAHRDGVDLVAVVLVARHHIKGGETRVFDAHGPHGLRFTLVEPWSTLLLDDARVIHEATPIQPAGDGDDGAPGYRPGHRDTLVVTLRRDGFQSPTAEAVG